MGLAWLFRRRKKPVPAVGPDPAEELKRKLEESRTAEPPSPSGEPPARGLEERRRAVHERARAAIDEMRSADELEGGDEPPER